MLNLIGLIPALPLLGFLILTAFGGRLPKSASAWIGAGSVGLAALSTGVLASSGLTGDGVRLQLWTWFAAADFHAGLAFHLDALALTMLSVVTGVGFLIHVYSIGYMAEDPGFSRFFAYMNLFVFAMLVLVLADNLPLLYLGWEGVGLCSYLLIGFWYEKPENGRAARKAFIVTRVGDTALALGLFLLFDRLGSLDIQQAMARAQELWPTGSTTATAAALLLLGGAVGKSAQLPLQVWLPDAMAGPTPISALIHAATMVTAGAYLIARTHPLFLLAPDAMTTVAAIGAITLLLSGLAALAQTDIKRVLAYSTISQIGYMFLALGVGAWSAAIFHLVTHAFFKALLFLAAGAVIVSLHHEQDIFRMGGLWKRLPVAFWSFVIGSAALVALPLTSGYYSKHEILLAAHGADFWLWGAGVLGSLLTAAYCTRLILWVFFGPPRGEGEECLPLVMTVPLVVLAALALFGGLLRPPLEAVFPPVPARHGAGVAADLAMALAPVLGIAAAYAIYRKRLPQTPFLADLRRFALGGLGFDALYGRLLVAPFCWLAAVNRADVVDRPYRAIVALAQGGHRLLSLSQNGRLRAYGLAMLAGVTVALAMGIWL